MKGLSLTNKSMETLMFAEMLQGLYLRGWYKSSGNDLVFAGQLNPYIEFKSNIGQLIGCVCSRMERLQLLGCDLIFLLMVYT
jgi:hypothetical protein